MNFCPYNFYYCKNFPFVLYILLQSFSLITWFRGNFEDKNFEIAKIKSILCSSSKQSKENRFETISLKAVHNSNHK